MKLVDPIAQSFFVNPTSGYFVTSLDLFFYSKDPESPIKIQLRSLKAGVPTNEVYKYAEVVLDPSKVSTSNDASLATRITFPSPVFLKGKLFHCICISTNSDLYQLHTSRLSQTDSSNTTAATFVSKAPNVGSIFKSQNGSTWTPVPSDDIKFTLYRADFTTTQGNISFYNPELTEQNAKIPVLVNNPLEISARKLRISLGSTILSTTLVEGNDVFQANTTGQGNYVGAAGSATGTLNIINAGIGYTPSSGSLTYNNVPLASLTGTGRNATADITITNGSVVAAGATIRTGGNGYLIGDVLVPTQIGASSLGLNMQLSVQTLAGVNELIVDNVQGEFASNDGAKTLKFVNSSGITSDLYFTSSTKAYPNNIIEIVNGEHIKVNHKNHGMHSSVNKVSLKNVVSDINPTTLTADYSNTSTANISIQDSTNFTVFENLAVSATNPGYIMIRNEIIAYTGVSGNTLTGITREIDQTIASTYNALEPVMKYELNGVSLRRINKTFTLSDSTEIPSIGLDYYKVKVDFSQNGNLQALPQGQTDRSLGSSLGKLYFNLTKSTGGSNIRATQNIAFEAVSPLVDAAILPDTNLTAKLRTVSGTSISGSEISYLDKGYSDIDLNSNYYFNSPRLVASKINETQNLSALPGNKSFSLNLQLQTGNPLVSPAIDVDRVAMSFISNRVDNLITNFATDNRVSSITNDPSAFYYVNSPIELQIPANAIKIYLTAHINIFNEVKCLYAVSNTKDDTFIYYPFPGYDNLDANKNPINVANNSGLPDSRLLKEDMIGFDSKNLPFKEYTFTVDNLPSFRYYSIKIVGNSTNQAYPPRIKDLRVIALAGNQQR